MMEESGLEGKVRKLSDELSALKEENEILVAKTEDIFLIGAIAERINFLESENLVIKVVLEDIALLKDFVYVSFLSLVDNHIHVVEDFGTTEISIKGRNIKSDDNLEAILAHNKQFSEITSDSSTPAIIPDLNVDPAPNSFYLVCLPFKVGPKGWLLFVNNIDGKSYLEKQRFLLDRAKEIIQARIESIRLLERLTQEATNRKKAEESLRISEGRYRLLVEGVNIVSWEFDPAGERFTFISRQAEALFGYSVERWYEKGFWPKLIHPEDRDRAVNYCFVAFQKGEDHDFEYRMKKSDGDFVWIRDIVQVVHSEGKPKSMRGVFIDITEQKKAEEELAESEKKYRLILNAAVEGVYGIDLHGVCTFANGSCVKMLGYDNADQLIGKNMHELIHHTRMDGAPYPMEDCHIFQAFREGKATNVSDEVFWRADGSSIPVEYWARPIQSDSGYVGSVVSFVDITERKQTEQKLNEAKTLAEEATKLKDKFVSLVAHDLKSPIGTTLGLLDYIDHDKENPLAPRHKEIFERVIESGKMMVRTIDELLNISRLQTGSIEIRKKFIDVHSVIMSVLVNVSYPAQQKGITILNDIPENTRIYVDYDLFANVIQNLISNAVKFCHKGDQVKVFVACKQPVEIVVEDTGVGIKPGLLADLFKHESKTSTPGTAGERGTGLGLPYSQDIINAHGGKLYATSQAGAGSSFHIELPAIKPCVLVVDDEPNVRALIKVLLGPVGAEIQEANNGLEALDSMKQILPHLIITDLKMPEMDGFELLKRLKQSMGFKQIPVLVVTSDEMESREDSFQLGADDFVRKPLVIEEFLPRVRRLLFGM